MAVPYGMDVHVLFNKTTYWIFNPVICTAVLGSIYKWHVSFILPSAQDVYNVADIMFVETPLLYEYTFQAFPSLTVYLLKLSVFKQIDVCNDE